MSNSMRYLSFFAVVIALCFLAAPAAEAQRGQGRGGVGSFADADANGDGKISKDEFRGPERAFAFMDADGDGFVTETEMESARQRRGGGQGGQGGGQGGGDADFFKSTALPQDDAEKRILDVLNEMSASGRRMQSVPMDDGRFLRLLAEAVNAQHVVEIGTSQGMSALWFAMALRKTGGKRTTFEIDPERAKLAKENFEKAGVEALITVVLGDAHEKVKEIEGPIDVLFLDADKQGYVDYLEKLLPKMRPGGLIIAHNITPSMADPAFLSAITSDKSLDSLLVTLQAGGISVSLKKR